MGFITAALYALLIVYLGGWIMDWWIGNFALVLMVLTTVTMAYWLAERFYFRPQRERQAAAVTEGDAQRRKELAARGIQAVDDTAPQAREQALAQPWWLDWSAGLFPVIAAVFVLRSFVVEPFKIPSGSMLPTLEVGDLILVNKYQYGLRLPVFHKKLVDNQTPSRGDVVVFRYPLDTRIDYIKRVVALPGDEVEWRNQRVTLNGKLVPLRAASESYDAEARRMVPLSVETLGATDHRVLVDPSRPSFASPMRDYSGPVDACQYTNDGVRCKVPAGHYFVMGDNRDNSVDSRFWGFVPEQNLVGRAFFVWMNFGNFGRVGSFR
jgi:signal peptidase I